MIMEGEDLGFTEGQVVGHLKNMLNYVEDRRIDYYVFTTSLVISYYHSMCASISLCVSQKAEE